MANPSAGDGLEIVSVGAIYRGPWDKKYWSSSRGKDRYPYPIGYRALRTCDGLSYTMEIRQGPQGPIFVVSSEDGTSCSGQTPDMAWQQFNKRGGAARRVSNCCRKRCPSSSSIDGIELFGFRNSFVQRLLRELVANGSGLPGPTLCSPSFADGLSNLVPEGADDSETGRAEPTGTFRDSQPLLERQWCSRKRSKNQLAVTSTDSSTSDCLLHLELPQVAEISSSGKQYSTLPPILENRRDCPLGMPKTCFGAIGNLVDKEMELDPHIGSARSGFYTPLNDTSYSTDFTDKVHELVQNNTCEDTRSGAAGGAVSKDYTFLCGEALCAKKICSSADPEKQVFSCDQPTSIGSGDQSKLRSVRGMHENKIDRSLDAIFIREKVPGVNDNDKNHEFSKVNFCADAELFIPDTLENTQESPTKKMNELQKKNMHELTEAMTVEADTHYGPPFVEQVTSIDRSNFPSQLSCQSIMQGKYSGNPVQNECEVDIEQSQSRLSLSSGSPYACSEGTDLEQSQPGVGELARSMMTFLLPRAVPLLKRTYHRRRKRKQGRETKGNSFVYSPKDAKSDSIAKYDSKNMESCKVTSATAKGTCTIDSGEIPKEKIDPKEVSERYMYRNNASHTDPDDLLGEKSIIPDSFDDDVSDTGTGRSMHISRSETDGYSKSAMLKDISLRKVDKKIKGCSTVIDPHEKIDPCKAEVTERELSICCSTGCMVDNRNEILQKVLTDGCWENEAENLLPIDRPAVYGDENNVCDKKQEMTQKDDSADYSFHTIESKYSFISESKKNILIEETCFAPIDSENIVNIVENGLVTEVCPSKVDHKISCLFERNRDSDGHLTHIKGGNNLKGTKIFLPLDASGVPPDTGVKACSDFGLASHIEKRFSNNKHELPYARDLNSVNPSFDNSLKHSRNHGSIDDKPPLYLDQGFLVEHTLKCNFKDPASFELGMQTDVSASAHIQTGSQCYLKPLCFFIHPDPILSIFLTTKMNELQLCVVTGILECSNRNIFIYKVSLDNESSNPPSFYGHTLIYVPVRWWCLDEKISFERSCIQFTAEEGLLVLHNSIKVPICRERNVNCLCSLCRSDSVEENGVKIVHVNNGYVSIIKKLITDHRVTCILACAPRHLIAAEESGILHVWMMISDWSETLEEYSLPSLSYGSRFIVELKRLRNCSLIIGRNGVGDFALWDFSKKVLLARFSSPDYLISQFLPVDCYSSNKEHASNISGNDYIHGKDATGMTDSQVSKHGEDSIVHHSLQKDVVWLLVCAYSGIESSAKFNTSNVNPVGCWRLAVLIDNRIFCGDILDSSASSVGVSLGEGILGTINGDLYAWEISSGKKMAELPAFNGGSISSLAVDPDSGALAVASNHREVLVYVRRHGID